MEDILIKQAIVSIISIIGSLFTGKMQKHHTDIPNSTIPITNTVGFGTAAHQLDPADPLTPVVSGVSAFAASLIHKAFKKKK